MSKWLRWLNKMMIEEFTTCKHCGNEKALTHYDSSGLVNWVACPKCKTYTEHGEIKKLPDGADTDLFWQNVAEDTEYFGE